MQHLHGETARGKKQHSTTHAAPDSDTAIQQARSSQSEEREQVIRRTAYAYYEARGCSDGHALDDWLRAEAQFPLASADPAQSATSSSMSH
jgi:hypothetical protein